MKRQPSVFWRGLRVIGTYIAAHPLPFTVAVTGAAVYAAMTVASTIVLGRITDRVLVPAFGPGVSLGPVLWGAVAIMAVAIIRAGGIVTRRYFAGMTGSRMMATLRTRVMDRYQELPLAYHRSRPTGELMAHAEADVMAATEVIHPLPYTTAVVLLIIFAVVALVLTDPFLALIGCSILPALTILNRYYGRKVEAPARRAQERIGDVSSVAHESIDGALVVKTLGRERAEVERLAQKAEALRDERVRFGQIRAAFEPAFEVLPNVGIVVLIGIGSWRVSTDAISIGTLVQFVSLFQLLAFPMRLIGFVLSDIPRAVAGHDRILEVLSEPVSLRPAAEALELPPGPLSLSVRDVRFSYAAAPVVDGVSFEVAPAQSVALVGPTGSGKSTLTQLLVRLADPDAGSIRVGGVDLRSVSAERLRAATAMVFQESFLFATSVRDNITLGRTVSDEEVHRAARLAQAHGFITALPGGYDTVLGERGVTLSGGQRQRVAIARGLVGRPRLLILDDATSSVDPTVEAAILDGLRRGLDTTLIVVAYRVSTIALADRVFFLDDGHIVASGTHDELLSHADYEAMVRAYERGAA
ncbi:MAG: ABC transporter ATP-binding protein [Actinomycetota bacterium]